MIICTKDCTIIIHIYIYIWLYTVCVNTNPARSVAGFTDASITFVALRCSNNDGISNYLTRLSAASDTTGIDQLCMWPYDTELNSNREACLIYIFHLVINIFPLLLNGKLPFFIYLLFILRLNFFIEVKFLRKKNYNIYMFYGLYELLILSGFWHSLSDLR